MLEHCVPEEEKIQAGILFCPADPELVAIKRKTHNVDVDYNMTHEDEFEKRDAILHEILGDVRCEGREDPAAAACPPVRIVCLRSLRGSDRGKLDPPCRRQKTVRRLL